MMKKFARTIVVSILGWQVRRLRAKHSFKKIVVVGSIGKTSTKFAIAQTLSPALRVRFQEGNYNDLASVPLVYFGQTLPSLFNPIAWALTFIRCELQIHKKYEYDVVILEIGTDGPGQIAAFKKYVHSDITVVTAIAPEHMEYFSDLDAVAKEELSVIQYTSQLLINNDLIAHEYTSLVPEALTYALHKDATYRISRFSFQRDGVSFELEKDGVSLIEASHAGISEPHLYSLAAAASVADLLGVSAKSIVDGLAHILPVSGRMQSLAGIRNSTIIDDTYNASPDATKAALETLYRVSAPQKIALLGNMNELGAFSKDAHVAIGELCDPKQLAHVITLGPDANEYLAAAAEQQGCTVHRSINPDEAGQFLADIMTDGAVVLVKGSQNKVYAEEAIKHILADPVDSQKLVRQSPAWLKKKKHNFKSV